MTNGEDMPKMKNFSYYVKEAFSNLFTNRTVTLTTIITVTVSLFIIGIFEIISLNTMYVSEQIGNGFEFQIYIKNSVPETDLGAVAEEIKSVEHVRDAVLKTKSETLTDIKNELGESSALAGLNEQDNPFRNSFLVTLTDLSSAQSVIDTIKAIPQVDSVSDSVEISQKIDAFSQKIRIYSIVAYILLALLCLSIVSNIINVSIFSRRKHINIMKYVGATDRFVRIPFILEGLIIGLFGSLLACGILIYAYFVLFGNFHTALNGLMNSISFMNVGEVARSLLVSNSVFGLLVGGLGASFAVGKYLKV